MTISARTLLGSSRWAASAALVLGACFSAHTAQAAVVGETIDWMGVTWNVYGEGGGTGNATIDGGTGNLLLEQTGGTGFGVRVNRLPTVIGGESSINANGTPFVQFAYQGITNPDVDFDVAIQDESVGGTRLFAGTLFEFTPVSGVTYNPNGGGARTTEYTDYSFTAADDLSGSSHDVTFGKDATGRYQIAFDEDSFTSNTVAEDVGNFDFNDVAIRMRRGVGETVQLTEFSFGDDFVIPEPASLMLLGAGGLALLSRRSRQSEDA